MALEQRVSLTRVVTDINPDTGEVTSTAYVSREVLNDGKLLPGSEIHLITVPHAGDMAVAIAENNKHFVEMGWPEIPVAHAATFAGLTEKVRADNDEKYRKTVASRKAQLDGLATAVAAKVTGEPKTGKN